MGFVVPAVAAVAGAFGGGGTALTAIGAGLGAASSIAGGIAARNQAKFQAQVAKNNAEISRRNADEALIAGQREESALRSKTTRLIAQQTAEAAASGVDVNVGSPLAVREADAMEGEMDALTLRYNAARQSYGFRMEASNQEASAKMYKKAGKNAMLQGFLGAGSSIIGGATSIMNQRNLLKAVGKGASKYGQGNAELSGFTRELAFGGS